MKKAILHIGCGSKKFNSAVGVDIVKLPGVDVIHDLNKVPYPFKKNQFDLIIAEHILEHLDSLTKVMEELHRISKNGAVIKITGPHYTSVDAFTDPTHKHFLTSRTFDYFIPGEDLHKYKYSRAKFKKIRIRLGPKRTGNFIIDTLLLFINKNIIFYEKHFSFLIPVGSIYYELETLK